MISKKSKKKNENEKTQEVYGRKEKKQNKW